MYIVRFQIILYHWRVPVLSQYILNKVMLYNSSIYNLKLSRDRVSRIDQMI